ncbi:PTS fructose transporter subunit IIA [Lacticaseibacillus paracasei]|uniref:PTS sugar transporter subunit IIA n=1 Tax=Lacticaseibacillus paracasei TaxID=1597 RepID=UPI002ADEC1F5|nr:PTS fructose transporter subunit IIA [Lacticaseibacillus paracasei]MEA0974155.1 PTS fructose transporter subunit IIA [Lacticaseibacillus paracasei]
MKKVIIATHYTLATGYKETLAGLTGSDDNVQAICAYVHNADKTELVQQLLRLLNSKDEFYIMTDLSFGSVNQLISQFISPRIHVVTGINLPFAMALTLAVKNALPVDLDAMITQARQELKVVTPIVAESVREQDDE